MSSSALAYPSPRIVGSTPRAHRRNRHLATPPLPLASIAIANAAVATSSLGRIKPPPRYVVGLIALAVAMHGAVAWYAATHSHSIPPLKHEVAVELVAPKPPQPKLEPPKPLPQKPQAAPQQAKVLPAIQTPTPEPSHDAGASDRPVVAVPPVANAAPVEAPPAPVTPPFGAAGYLNNPPPDYPPVAARAGWEGIVQLHVHVLSNGHADAVEVQKSSGRKALDDEAVKTVKRWTFTPSKRGDTPVDGWANVPIEFKLEQ